MIVTFTHCLSGKFSHFMLMPEIKVLIYQEGSMWLPLTDEQRLVILKAYGIECDRLVREKERYEITSISRTQAWKLEREGTFPPRKSIGKKSCGWLLSDLLCWIQTR